MRSTLAERYIPKPRQVPLELLLPEERPCPGNVFARRHAVQARTPAPALEQPSADFSPRPAQLEPGPEAFTDPDAFLPQAKSPATPHSQPPAGAREGAGFRSGRRSTSGTPSPPASTPHRRGGPWCTSFGSAPGRSGPFGESPRIRTGASRTPPGDPDVIEGSMQSDELLGPAALEQMLRRELKVATDAARALQLVRDELQPTPVRSRRGLFVLAIQQREAIETAINRSVPY